MFLGGTGYSYTYTPNVGTETYSIKLGLENKRDDYDY